MGRRLLKALSYELDKINNEELRRVVKDIIAKKCDDKNAEGPASSSGKYHPQFSLGKSGLIRHTKVVCLFTERILSMMPQYDDKEAWDIPYAAAILHDLKKFVKDQEHTQSEHPLLMGNEIREFGVFFGGELKVKLDLIADIVDSHMSRWNTDKTGKKLGETPTKFEHYIIAIADMISATRNIKIEFDGENNVV